MLFAYLFFIDSGPNTLSNAVYNFYEFWGSQGSDLKLLLFMRFVNDVAHNV